MCHWENFHLNVDYSGSLTTAQLHCAFGFLGIFTLNEGDDVDDVGQNILQCLVYDDITTILND